MSSACPSPGHQLTSPEGGSTQVCAAAKLTENRSANRVTVRAHALRVRRIRWSSIASALVPVETPSRGPRLTEITGTSPDQFLLQIREFVDAPPCPTCSRQMVVGGRSSHLRWRCADLRGTAHSLRSRSRVGQCVSAISASKVRLAVECWI